MNYNLFLILCIELKNKYYNWRQLSYRKNHKCIVHSALSIKTCLSLIYDYVYLKRKNPCSFQKILNSRPARIYYFLYFSLGFFLDKALNYENIRENFTVKSQSLLLAFCS